MFAAQKIMNIFSQVQTNIISNYTTDSNNLPFNNIYQANPTNNNLGKARRSSSNEIKPKK
jgi:hypothetical protein